MNLLAAKQRGINPTTSTPVPFSLRRRGAGDEAIKHPLQEIRQLKSCLRY